MSQLFSGKDIMLRKKGLRFRWDIILGPVTTADHGIIKNWICRFTINRDKFFDDLLLWSNGKKSLSAPLSDKRIEPHEISGIENCFKRQITDLNISGFPKIILNDRILSPVYTPLDLEFIIIDGYSNE